MTDIHYWTAFVAGLLSFFSPCVLAPGAGLYSQPGRRLGHRASENRQVWPTLLHSIAFVLGFSILFILMGASAGLIGSAMTAYAETLRIISGIVVIIIRRLPDSRLQDTLA